MIEFEVKQRKLTIGKRKGETAYFAVPKSGQRMTNRMVIDRIVRETSLSAGDVSSALISLAAIVRDAMLMGQSVDLGELGSFRISVPSRMMSNVKEVTVDCLKTPKIIFTPRAAMRAAAGAVELSVDNPHNRKPKPSGGAGTLTPPGGSTPTPPGGGGGSDDDL